MFNLGITELLVIGIILIVVVGPDRLPVFMKTIGKGLRGLRQASRDLRQSVGFDEMMREDYLRSNPPPRIPPKPLTPAVSREEDPAKPPAESDTPDTPDAPVTPDAAVTPDAPVTPDAAVTPDAPVTPGTTKAKDTGSQVPVVEPAVAAPTADKPDDGPGTA